jgi:hypothetical protein
VDVSRRPIDCTTKMQSATVIFSFWLLLAVPAVLARMIFVQQQANTT